MGNAISPCIPISTSSINLIFYDGTTRILHGKRLAAEIMFEFPDCMVCHANSFFIGQPIPILAYDAYLVNGETYFVLPLDSLPCSSNILTASSLATLSSGSSPSPTRGAPVNFVHYPPFEYLKGSDGKVLIKVTPEFIIKVIKGGKEEVKEPVMSPRHASLCSTPELKKHYDHLVGSKEQVWSPKLETISESKGRFSPWLRRAYTKTGS